LFSSVSQDGPSIFKLAGGPIAAAPAAKPEGGNESGDDDVEQDGEKSPPIYADSATKVEFKGAGAQAI